MNKEYVPNKQQIIDSNVDLANVELWVFRTIKHWLTSHESQDDNSLLLTTILDKLSIIIEKAIDDGLIETGYEFEKEKYDYFQIIDISNTKVYADSNNLTDIVNKLELIAQNAEYAKDIVTRIDLTHIEINGNLYFVKNITKKKTI